MFCLPYSLKSKGKCLEGKEVSLSYFCRRIKWHLRKCLPDPLIIPLAWIRGSAEHPSEAERPAHECSVFPDVPVLPVPSDSPRSNNCSVALAHGPQDGRPFPRILRSQALPEGTQGNNNPQQEDPSRTRGKQLYSVSGWHPPPLVQGAGHVSQGEPGEFQRQSGQSPGKANLTWKLALPLAENLNILQKPLPVSLSKLFYDLFIRSRFCRIWVSTSFTSEGEEPSHPAI